MDSAGTPQGESEDNVYRFRYKDEKITARLGSY